MSTLDRAESLIRELIRVATRIVEAAEMRDGPGGPTLLSVVPELQSQIDRSQRYLDQRARESRMPAALGRPRKPAAVECCTPSRPADITVSISGDPPEEIEPAEWEDDA